LFYGLAVRSDGHLFVSGGGDDRLTEYAYDPTAAQPLTAVGEIRVPGLSYVAGLAFIDDDRLLAAYQGTRLVALLDSRAGRALARASCAPAEPYDIVVDTGAKRAYVSLWGAEDIAALDVSGATPTLVGRVTTGKNPEGLLLWPPGAPTKLLSANSDADTV